MNCGRIRKPLTGGWNQLTDRELQNQKIALLILKKDEQYTIHTREYEYSLVVLEGAVAFAVQSGQAGTLGPRRNVFEDLPEGLLLTREEEVTLTAVSDCQVGIHYAPAPRKFRNYLMKQGDIRVNERGADNWRRAVRKIFWNDNSEGNGLLTGETVTFPGNWSTMPPHRHQFFEEGKEMPYEEGYLFKFSHPKGFGLIYQFDDDGQMDQAFSLKSNDVAYVGGGYHPVVAAPGSYLYHLTCMAGPQRMSQARVHADYAYLLQEQGLENQFTPQR